MEDQIIPVISNVQLLVLCEIAIFGLLCLAIAGSGIKFRKRR